MTAEKSKGFQSTPDKRRVIRAPRVGDLLGKSQHAVYLMVYRGQLPYMRRGRELFFYEDEIVALLEAGRQVSLEEAIEEAQTA